MNRRVAAALVVLALVSTVLAAIAATPARSAARDVTGEFFPLPPARILDTRTTNSPVGPGLTLVVPAAGHGGVPSTGVSAVVVNLTATAPTAVSYLTAYPAGGAVPVASNLNFAPGQTVANLAQVKLGSGGAFTVFNAQGFTHVIADVVGWYSDGTTAAGTRYTALAPARILDTRTSIGAVAGDTSIDVPAAGHGGVPASGVSAVVVNLTATDPTMGTYLTAYPAGGLPPLASNLNLGPGQTVPNLAVVKLGDGGAFSVYNAQGLTHVIVDVVGWYSDGATADGSTYNALTPARVLDTRIGHAPIGPNATLDVPVAGRGGVPAAGVSAVVLNLTATEPTAGSYLTAFPAGTSAPLASNLNFPPGRTVANLVVVKLGSGGAFSIYNAQGYTHAIADVVGWFTGAAPSPTSTTTTTPPTSSTSSSTSTSTSTTTTQPQSTTTTTTTLPPPPPATASVAFQHDVAHTGGSVDPALPAHPTQLWRHDFVGTVGYPLVVSGRVYVTAASASDASTSYGSRLYAFDERTGAMLWAVDLGGLYRFSAIAYDGGRVFAINFDGLLRAFDAVTGLSLWSESLPYEYAFTSPPTASRGVVYVGGAGSGGVVYAVRESDGALLWTQAVANGDNSSPAVSTSGIYVSYACDYTFAMAPATGALLWSYYSGCEGGGGRTPVLYGGRLYIRDWASGPIILDAATGGVLGTFSAGPPPAFAGSHGFFVNGSLTAQDVNTGLITWETGSSFTSAPIVANGIVYVGDGNGTVHGIRATDGVEVWSADAGAPIMAPNESGPGQVAGLAQGDGMLFVPASSSLVAYG